MRHLAFLWVIALAAVAVAQSDQSDTQNRRLEAARHLARVYLLAIPIMPGDVVGYVNEHRNRFVEEGDVIQMAKAVGSLLVAGGINAYDPETADRAHEAALSSGLNGEQAQGVADSISSGALEMVALGRELLWLAEVLPPVTNGNLIPYQTTGTARRQQIRILLSMYGPMLQDPEMRQILIAALKISQPAA